MVEDAYRVECRCGRSLPVRSGQAGSTIICECGDRVSVPRLADLRKSAGQTPYAANAVTAIRRAINEGTFPGCACFACQGPARHNVRCRVVCERSYQVREGDEPDLSFAGFLFAIISPVWIRRRHSYAEFRGRDTQIELLLPVCHACLKSGGSFRRRRTLKRHLKQVPQYKRLFDEYPAATIHDIAIEDNP